MKRRMATVALGVGAMAALVGIWEVAERRLDLNSTAPPSEIVSAWWRLVTEGELVDRTAHTLRAFGMAWTVAVVTGTVLGLVLGASQWTRRFLDLSVTFFRFIPPPALIPVVILIWGFELPSEVLLPAFAATWPITINMSSGVQQVDPRLLDVGRTFGLGTLGRARKLIIPSAMPMLVTGIRIGTTICLVVLIAIEIIGVPRGLGNGIVFSSQALRPADAFAYVVWCAVLGVVIGVAIRAAERYLLRWRIAGAV